MNKVKKITNSIIHERGHLLKMIFDAIHIFRYYNNYYTCIDKRIEQFYKIISNINFNKLNEYCWFGNFSKDEYIFYNYFNNYNSLFDNIEDILKKLYIDEWHTTHKDKNKYYFLIFIIFSTDKERYNKLYKDKLKISRKILIVKLFKKYIKEYLKVLDLKKNHYNYDDYLTLLMSYADDINFYNLSFQGNIFFNIKNIFYDIMFTDDYDLTEKYFFFEIFEKIFFDLLYSIQRIIFLPLYIIFKNNYMVYFDFDQIGCNHYNDEICIYDINNDKSYFKITYLDNNYKYYKKLID